MKNKYRRFNPSSLGQNTKGQPPKSTEKTAKLQAECMHPKS
jgi:hypothetical protein